MNELNVYNGNVLTIDEHNAFDLELDKYISRNKSNRQEINRLVFEAVATMTEADEAQADLENKSFLQRCELENLGNLNENWQSSVLR